MKLCLTENRLVKQKRLAPRQNEVTPNETNTGNYKNCVPENLGEQGKSYLL
jgi:hypothetical protein